MDSPNAGLPAEPGTYVLLLGLSDAVELTVGRLGICRFPAGWYAYIGSAFGPGGLRARLVHHLQVARRPHWHLDHLRRQAQPVELWLGVGLRREHAWAGLFQSLPGVGMPAARFGASDCRCPAHLFHADTPAALAAFRSLAARRFPDDPPLLVWDLPGAGSV